MNHTNQVAEKYIESPYLMLNQVSFSWPCGKKALRNCNFSINSPGLWMLVGANGSGKSTLFKVISGLLKQDSGKVFCKSKPALVFQNPDHHLLLPTCSSDLLLSVPNHLNTETRMQRVQESLEQVGLAEMRSRPIHTLSGGQKQRLAIASAIASNSELLLLDEPTALLDPSSQNSVITTVKQLCSRPNNPLTAIWITHRLEELEHANGVAKMDDGMVHNFESGKKLRQLLHGLAVRRV